jgi:hypothetical protein
MFLNFEKELCNWGESCNWDTNLVYSRSKNGVFYEFFCELKPILGLDPSWWNTTLKVTTHLSCCRSPRVIYWCNHNRYSCRASFITLTPSVEHWVLQGSKQHYPWSLGGGGCTLNGSNSIKWQWLQEFATTSILFLVSGLSLVGNTTTIMR